MLSLHIPKSASFIWPSLSNNTLSNFKSLKNLEVNFEECCKLTLLFSYKLFHNCVEFWSCSLLKHNPQVNLEGETEADSAEMLNKEEKRYMFYFHNELIKYEKNAREMFYLPVNDTFSM